MQSVLGGSDSADNRDFADNINKSRRGVFSPFFVLFGVCVCVCACACVCVCVCGCGFRSTWASAC